MYRRGPNPVSVVRPIVFELLAKGGLTLYGSRKLGEDETEVAGQEVEGVLRNPQNWSAPDVGDMQYHLATTDAGNTAYYSGGA